MRMWNLKSGVYDAARRLPVVKQIYEAELRNLCALWPQRQCAVQLDLGCGTGATLHALPRARLCVAADFSEKMLARLPIRKDTARAQLDAGELLPFRSSAFELVTAIGLTEYLTNLEFFFAETWRVAQPGAQFVVTSTPPTLLARLRFFAGSRLHLRTRGEVELALSHAGWGILEHKKSLMQEQWLCIKKF